MPLATLDYSPQPEFDTGRFFTIYLQSLAWLSILSMVLAPIFFGSLNIDLSPIFYFWAASALKRHSNTARRWVIFFSGFALITVFFMMAWAASMGRAE